MAREARPAAATRRCLLASLALIAPWRGSAAEPTAHPLAEPAPPPSAATRADLDLEVNGEPRGSLLVVIRGGDVLMEPHQLEEAGIVAPGAAREVVEGVPRVSLRSLAPDLTFEVDERGLALRLRVGPQLLAHRTLDLRAAPRPAGMVARSDPSLFLDYAVEGRAPGPGLASFELGTSGGGWLLLGGVSRIESGEWARGLTSLTRDEPEALRRWIAGDAVASAGPLGGAGVVGGLSVQREYSLDPYLVRSPMPRGSAVATTASTLEVYVNGSLVRRERLAPGVYDLANLPATSGAGVVHAVLRDAFGRTQELDARYYFSSGLLAEGLSDYGYHLGWARSGVGAESFDYGEPVALARHRIGLSDWLTAGLRAEGSRSVVSGGPGVTLALALGELEGTAAASGSGGQGGAAGVASWSYLAGGLSAGLRLAAQSPAYANTSLAPYQDRPLLSADAILGSAVLPASLTLEASVRAERWRDSGDQASLGLRASVGLGRGASLLLSASFGRGSVAGPTAELLATLTWSLGGRSTADASVGRGPGGGGQGAVGAQQSLPLGDGFGYRVRGQGGGDAPSSASGLGQAQGRYGLYELEWSQVGSVQQGRASAAGALVLIDGRLFATRPVDSSFALVQVPGVEGVRASLEGQEMGRTDRDGDLLVPALLPYQANRLSIRGEDVPVDHDLGAVEILVAPPLRGGAVARFDVRPLGAVTGALSLPGSPARPSRGEISLGEGTSRVSSPVTAGGRFWLEGVPPGRHRALVTWGEGTCRAVLEVADGARGVVDLGEVACAPEAELAAGRQ